MNRRTFVHLLAISTAFSLTPGTLLPSRVVGRVVIRPRRDRAWLFGMPGRCAGSRRRLDDFGFGEPA